MRGNVATAEGASRPRGLRGIAIVALLPLCASCSLQSAYVHPDLNARRAPADLEDGIETTLLLVGDAGLATSSRDPILAQLRDAAAVAPGRTVIVFLGDNVYPSGLPPVGHEQRPAAERTLRAQASVAASGAQVIFLSGNHDYGYGLDGLREQQAFIESLPGQVRFAPNAGTTGPTVIDFGRCLRLALLDSEWMIDHPGDPLLPLDDTGPGERPHLVVAAHHPLASHGTHGGFFTWRDHLFPLVAEWDWAWLPLPVLGSAYPLSRLSGISKQDLSNARNQRYQHRLEKWFDRAAPLVFAAGHEHALQLLRGKGAGFLVVSGAGTVDRHESVSQGRDTLFASPASGFFRLDFFHDHRVRLTVIEVDRRSVRSPLSIWLVYFSYPAGPPAGANALASLLVKQTKAALT